MRTKFRKQFLKDLTLIPTKIRLQIEQFVFYEIPLVKTIGELVTIEKMKGHKYYYKVRFGVYRVGLRLEIDTIILERVLHRKEIYRYFP